jgi:hypothetical protein
MHCASNHCKGQSKGQRVGAGVSARVEVLQSPLDMMDLRYLLVITPYALCY